MSNGKEHRNRRTQLQRAAKQKSDIRNANAIGVPIDNDVGRSVKTEEASEDDRECDASTDVRKRATETIGCHAECMAGYSAGGLLDISTTFEEFGNKYLDRRLTKAIISTLGLHHPTLVQSSAIPLILEGKDVLARARTGSGKTLAYCLPLLQKLLEQPEGNSLPPLQGCILVPSRELCIQVCFI